MNSESELWMFFFDLAHRIFIKKYINVYRGVSGLIPQCITYKWLSIWISIGLNVHSLVFVLSLSIWCSLQCGAESALLSLPTQTLRDLPLPFPCCVPEAVNIKREVIKVSLNWCWCFDFLGAACHARLLWFTPAWTFLRYETWVKKFTSNMEILEFKKFCGLNH